jgi:TonB family protein
MSTNTIDPPVSHLTPTRKPGETQRLQTLCIEVPVTVQGSRNTHPSAPFLEETRTVIVFPQGAVLRLSEIVVQGQIVIVQNMRVRQEVACRVISSKPGASAKGYVELEFTQPAPGFWGISFPGEAIAPRPVVPEAVAEPAAPVASVPSAPMPVVSAPAVPAPVVSTPPEPMEPEAQAEIQAPIATAASPMSAPAKLTPETTLELNRAIAASFANLREAVMSPSVSEIAKPAAEKKEPSAKPAVETRPAPVSETRPTPAIVAPPMQKPAMPPVNRSAPPPASAPMNSAARDQSRTQNTLRETAPVTLADSMVQGEGEMIAPPKQRVQNGAQTGTQTDWSRPPKTSETITSAPKSDSRRASGLNSEGLTLMSDLGAAPDPGNQLLSAKAAERSRTGRTRMVLVTAAVVLIAAGAGAYFWYAKTHGASARSVSGNAAANVSGAGLASVAPGAVTPNAATSNSQPPNAGGSQAQNARQANNQSAGNSSANNSATSKSGANNPALKNPGAQAPAAGANNSASNNKPNNTQTTLTQPPSEQQTKVNARQPNVLPMKIAAPTAPSRSAAQNNVSAPDLGYMTTSANANSNPAMTGSILSSSMPAAPPPAPGGGSASNSAGLSVVREAKLISSVMPVYPKVAEMRGDTGVVTVDATVDEQGKVTSAKAIDGPQSLRMAAVDAVNKWKYQPATLNGKPVLEHVLVKLIFSGKK